MLRGLIGKSHGSSYQKKYKGLGIGISLEKLALGFWGITEETCTQYWGVCGETRIWCDKWVETGSVRGNDQHLLMITSHERPALCMGILYGGVEIPGQYIWKGETGIRRGSLGR